MLTLPSSADTLTRGSIDDSLSPLLALAETAVITRSRIYVLSLWKQLPLLPIFASHLHLRWPGKIDPLSLSPRIGLFPFFASDMELLSRPLYSVHEAQQVRKSARAKRFSTAARVKSELYPDWEQAVDRWPQKLNPLTLPASSFISVDRVNEYGQVKAGNRQIIGRLAPRGEPRPRFLVPSRVEVTRQLIRAFDDLDLVLVNVQNVRGKQLSASIQYFLQELLPNVPVLIVASSPADLAFVGALENPTKVPVVLAGPNKPLTLSVKAVNKDRALAERQFCFAIEDLDGKSDILTRLVAHSKRTWWAVRQSLSEDSPHEATAFAALYEDMLERSPGCELELLEEAKRLILHEAENCTMRTERRDAVIEAALHEAKAGSVLVLVRSAAAAEALAIALARYLDIQTADLATLGIDVLNVFAPWPDSGYETCIACGYFGTSTIDMIFACGARNGVLIADPIEARVALWDVDKRFQAVADLPASVTADLKTLSAKLEATASPSATPISLPLFAGASGRGGAPAAPSTFSGKPNYVCLCFVDGSTRECTANARFEVVGRKRLQLQSIAAKDLHVGDQVVLLNDDERAGFSERLLQVMDEGRFRSDKKTRSTWVTTLRAVRAANRAPAYEIKQLMESAGVVVDVSTIRSWLPSLSTDDCGVPESEEAYLAFAKAAGVAIPAEILSDWFVGINRLRINHRKIGRQLVRAIRGAYHGRLDSASIAKMEKEWGVEAKTLLEAARLAVVDDVIPLGGETND